jgi:hypothetical protein
MPLFPTALAFGLLFEACRHTIYLSNTAFLGGKFTAYMPITVLLLGLMFRRGFTGEHNVNTNKKEASTLLGL